MLDLVGEVVNSGVEYSYLHFLQNSDLPIKRNADILEFFERHQGVEFIQVDENNTKWANQCCRYRYWFSHNRFYRTSKIMKGANLLCARIQRLLKWEKNSDCTFYYGSALFSITMAFARYLHLHEREIYQQFRWALAPDEKFMQTILKQSPFASNVLYISPGVTSNAMLIDWTRERDKNSPHVWRQDELSYLLAHSEEACYARKFMENVDLEVVRMLEERLLRDD